MYKFHMREWAVEKVSAVSMNCIQVGGKETKDRKKKIYTHELRLLFASDLPIGSILKMLSLNRMQLEDLNLCKKLHNYGAVELTVHISKGCVCFLFTPLCIVQMSLYHMHLKIKMRAKSPSNVKRERHFLSCPHSAGNSNWYFWSRGKSDILL